MKNSIYKFLILVIGFQFLHICNMNAQRQMEKLDRGVVAVKVATGVFISWRILGNERIGVGYNLYKNGTKLNTELITGASNYSDPTGTVSDNYQVAAVINGLELAKSSQANVWAQNYLDIPLQIPAGGITPASEAYTYSPNDCSIADLDGDGEYDIVVKWEPSNAKDNSQSGYTGPVILDAYKFNGTHMWRINLGINIRAGAHYTQFMVYDLDGDGKAEVVCKTADGTTDGLGTVIGNGTADYRNTSGYILTGPEFLTVFSGQTGAALTTVNYDVPRGVVSDWGDSNGNRVDRFLACVAYLDGSRPSVVMCRGYYTRAYLAAWDWRNGTLTKRWVFDSNTGGNGGYYGQGNHNLSVADVDNDGKDEIIYGSCTIDDNGTGKYTTGLGHGDALHVSDFDPDRPGLEVWAPHETATYNGNVGASFRDARTGTLIWKYMATGDIGRGMAGDIDPSYKGAECWAAGSPLYNSKGGTIVGSPNSINFRIFWDGDDLDELLNSNRIYKHNYGEILNASGCSSNNGTKSTPAISADVLGDWREEVIFRTDDNSKLRIYTTTATTSRRMYTLMHDPAYRMAIAWQNVAYNQPPHLSFYLAGDPEIVPPSPIVGENLIWKGDVANNIWDNATSNFIKNGASLNYQDGDSVLFDFSGASGVPVTLASDVQPAAISVISTSNYTFSGSGKISGNTMLIKSGSGKLILNNHNNFTGNTEIWDGALIINDTLENSQVFVRGGVFGGVKSEGKEGGRIAGRGILVTNVTLLNKGCISPGNDYNSADSLTIIGNLTEKGIAINLFDLSDDPSGVAKANDWIKVIGNIKFSDSVYFSINKLNASLTPGEYVLFKYTGTFTGNIGKISVIGIPGIAYSIEDKNNTIVLKIAEMRSPSSIVWTGAINGTWDLATTANWQKAELPDVFVTGDTVKFTDNSPANNIINISDPSTTTASILVEGSQNYTFGGVGSILGTGGITKTGEGKFIINNTNGFTGNVNFSGGSLEIANVANGGIASSIGAGSTASSSFVLSDISVKYNGANATSNRGITLSSDTIFMEIPSGRNLTYSGVVAGAGKLVKIGAGIFGMSGNNNYSGGTILKSGTIQMGEYSGTISALGSGTLTMEGGTLVMSGAVNDNASYNTFNTNIIIPNGATASISADGRCDIYSTLTGNGTLNLYVPFTRSIFYGNWVNFTGNVNLTSDANGGECRLYNSNGYPNTLFNLASGVTLLYNYGQSPSNGSQNVTIGALSGVSGSYLIEENWTIGTKNINTTFGGIISGNSVTKVGTGTFTLTNANTYAGGTNINGGILLASNTSGSATGTGLVNINNTGVLSGTGIINSPVSVNNGGAIAAGNIFGTLIFNNNVTFQTGSRMLVDVNAASNTSDRILVNGSYKCTLNGTLEINNTSATPFANGNSFTILTGINITGSFTAINPAFPGSGLIWDTTLLRPNGIIKVITDTGTYNPYFNKPIEVTVFPNPVKDKIEVKLSRMFKNVLVSVANLSGKTLISQKVNLTQRFDLDLSEFPQGVYLIQVQVEGNKYIRKIIKE